MGAAERNGACIRVWITCDLAEEPVTASAITQHFRELGRCLLGDDFGEGGYGGPWLLLCLPRSPLKIPELLLADPRLLQDRTKSARRHICTVHGNIGLSSI